MLFSTLHTLIGVLFCSLELSHELKTAPSCILTAVGGRVTYCHHPNPYFLQIWRRDVPETAERLGLQAPVQGLTRPEPMFGSEFMRHVDD